MLIAQATGPNNEHVKTGYYLAKCKSGVVTEKKFET